MVGKHVNGPNDLAPGDGETIESVDAMVDQYEAEWLGTLEPATDRSRSPLDVARGTRIGDFEIERLLGRGGFARVYLARQRSLDRLVALKVSRAVGDEGRTLAQLDHPHIVPVYSEQVLEGRKLLAMRYVPGKTLADWLVGRGTIDRRRWRRQDLLAWIDLQLEGRAGRTSTRAGLIAVPFVPTMVRLVLGLASALRHAHEQGVLHCDIKPANILLDVDGRALLMDFNVAARHIDQPVSGRSLLGGTLPYMAPEHLATLIPGVGGPAGSVDRRSDIYALGVVFYELLTGSHPWSQPETAVAAPAVVRQMLAARLRGAPELPSTVAGAGLRSIVAKCLDPNTAERYQSATELVDDLERWLDHRPLAVAPDPSRTERASKWVCRHPLTTTVLATVAVAGIVSFLLALWSDCSRLGRAETLLVRAAKALDGGDSSRAADQVDAARNVLSRQTALPMPLTAQRRTAADQRITALERQIAIVEMRQFQTLNDRRRATGIGSAGPRDLAADPLRIYHVLQQHDWEQLPAFRGLDAGDQLRVSEDITELLLARAVAWTDSRSEHDGGEPSEPSSTDDIEAIELLNRVPTIHRDLPLLVALRGALASNPPAAIPTVVLIQAADSQLSHYLTGVVAAQRGEYELAIDALAISEACRPAGRPPRFWTKFLHAYCCERLGRIPEAIIAYGICIGLRQDFAWSYNNLGLIHTRQGDHTLAIGQFEQAIRYGPSLAAAHANLGVALFQAARFAAASTAFGRAIDLGQTTAEVFANRAAARAALGDRAGARQDLEHALSVDPQSELARENIRRLETAP